MLAISGSIWAKTILCAIPVDDKVTASDVEQWFDVENDDDVRDAVVADIVDGMEKITIKTLRKRLSRMKWRLMK